MKKIGNKSIGGNLNMLPKDISLKEIIYNRSHHRETFVDLIREAIPKDENWQMNKTPVEIIDKMVSKTELKDKTILVLFNVEIIDRLISYYKVPPENLFFFADHPLELLFVEKIYKVRSTWADKEIMIQDNKEEIHPLVRRIQEMGQKKFDLVLSNPPYNRGVDLKILSVVEPMTAETVVVHPANFLLEIEERNDLYKAFRNQISSKAISFEIFNLNKVFDINNINNAYGVITHLKSDNPKKVIKVRLLDDEFEVEQLDDITKFGKSWIDIIKTFHNKMMGVCTTDNVYKRVYKNLKDFKTNKNEFVVQFPVGRGNIDKSSNATVYKDDFYTFFSNNTVFQEKHLDSNQCSFEGAGKYLTFKTKTEQINFFNYMKTDFARFCLALLKKHKLYLQGEMSLIPWLDFTQEWDDEKLYKFFDVDEKTQEYIENFLPDYYGIRDKKKNKTYFGSVKPDKISMTEKSSNILLDKQKAKKLSEDINKMIEETDEEENLCLFLSKNNKRLTVTKDYWKKKKDK